MKVAVFLAWYDLWVGLFWDQKKQVLYICPLPCIVIKVECRRSGEEENNEREKWKIDHTAGRPILTYEGCSVIQDEQAEYIINLIQKDRQ